MRKALNRELMYPIRPSRFVLPAGGWLTVLDCLTDQFSGVSREQWISRFERGRVITEQGAALSVDAPYHRGLKIAYYREIPDEKEIPFYEIILYQDDDLLVVDKPHFLPVTPVGGYVLQTLQARLIKRFENPEIQPVHRIDRHTAGLVLFSLRKESRNAYQALFREHRIEKRYEAIAPALTDVQFPHKRMSRIVRGEPFYLSQEVEGEINAISVIDVLKKKQAHWHYQLQPISGKKHQLRLHMAALGAPILNDPLYPVVCHEEADNYAKPLQLLASEIRFTDPLTQEIRYFKSKLALMS